MSRAVPPPAARPPERAARVPRPVCPGCGQCGCGDPAPAPQRAPLRAGVARCGGGGGASPGGVPSAILWGVWGQALPLLRLPALSAGCRGSRPLVLSGVRPGPTAHWLWVRGVRVWGPVTNPTARALACFGGSMRVPGGGASCLGVGRPGSGALPARSIRPFGRAARARFALAVGAVCGRGGPAVLGTLSRAAVRRVLCALPGFAAPDGRCGLAPVLVPWLWPAACLSGVPRGPALVRRSSSGPVALGAPVGFPVAVVPSLTPEAVAPGLTGWLRGARGGRPRTGLIVPAAGPCRGKGAGRAPCRTRSGPRDGIVPGGSLRLRSWAACAAVVWRVWTRSLTRPVLVPQPQTQAICLCFTGGKVRAIGAVSWCSAKICCADHTNK